MYDSRLGRRWERDPVTYAWQSPYATFNNNPIVFIDPKGLFGSRKEARKYVRENKSQFEGGVKIGKSGDGEFVLQRKRDGAQFVYGAGTTGFEFKKPSKTTAQKVDDWISSTDFVFEMSGKLDFGLQGKIRGSYGGVVQGQANINLVSYELLSGRVDLTELGSDNPDAYSGNYIGDGDGAKVTQSIGVTGGVGGYDVVGAEVKHTFRTHGSGYFDENVDYGIYGVVPLLKSKNAKQVQRDVLKDMNLVKSPQIKDPKVGKQGDFYGIDVGAGAALILGVDVNLKVGFKR